MMKKVYICAPLGGNVEKNLEAVKRYAEFALRSGVAPVVPHYYALSLDDNDPHDREIGIAAGLGLLWFCDEMWIFGNYISAGMRTEMNFCKNLNIKMKKIYKKDIKKILEVNSFLRSYRWAIEDALAKDRDRDERDMA